MPPNLGGFFMVRSFFFQAEDGIRDLTVTGVQTCALPISCPGPPTPRSPRRSARAPSRTRSEEHTSELQSQSNLVCRLLLEKKKRRTSTGLQPCPTELSIRPRYHQTRSSLRVPL